MAEKKIKVIRIIARLNVGGPARHTILLTQGLNNKRFSSILVTGKVDKGEEDMLYFAREKNVNPLIIPELQRRLNLVNDLIAFWKIFLLIKKERPDIIHTHTAKAGTLGRLAGILYNTFGLRKRTKLIHTFHGTVLAGYFGKIKSRFFIWIERILAYFTDTIVAVTETLKTELLNLKIGNPKKLSVIHLGIDIEELLSLAPANNSILKIGIIGRLVPIKNHKMFFEAAKIFLTSYKLPSYYYRFLVIGDGKLRKDLESYVLSLGINSFVEFQGWHSELAKIYNSLDIVVVTSINEGTPLCLIEAMSAAKPIIATDVGGVKDLFIRGKDYGLRHSDRIKIYDNGILCKSDDSNGLAEALDLLLRNRDLREKMGNSGRVFVRNRFSKERLIQDIEMLYNNYLKRSC